MVFLVAPNVTSSEAMACAMQLMDDICNMGHEACLAQNADAAYLSRTNMALVVGGDGTVLRAVREMHKYHFPFWAVNCGHLGYLTDCEPRRASAVLRQILSGGYRLEHRVTLEGEWKHDGQVESFFALNEAVIHRSAYARTLKMRLSVGGASIMRFAGDGVLVSTPTGSTAYNLSAGGPILLPESQQAVVTPICPHAALCAPLVVSGTEKIVVTIGMNGETGDLPLLVIDGCDRYPLHNGDTVSCCLRGENVQFVRTGAGDFYSRLQRKLTQNR